MFVLNGSLSEKRKRDEMIKIFLVFDSIALTPRLTGRGVRSII